jgi:hypothetical protein
VANPFAKDLSFVDHQTRTRRDHMKYLTLIRAIALLHQYQRPIKTAEHRGHKLRYIEVSREDIEVANRLAKQVLTRSFDELPPQTRRLLEKVEKLVIERAQTQGIERSDVRFTQRELRGYSGWSATQVKVQLGRLQELEYVAVHYQGHRQRHLYELLTSAEGASIGFDGGASECDLNRSGFLADRSATGPASERPVLLSNAAEIAQPVRKSESTYKGQRVNATSYRSDIFPLAAKSELTTDHRPLTT